MKTELLMSMDGLWSLLPVVGNHGEADVTAHLPVLVSWGLVLGIIVALLLLALCWPVNRWGSRLNVSGKFLTRAFSIVWLAGFVIYDVGMYIDHSRLSLITNAPMAIIHATEMFLLHSDVAAIHHQFHDNLIFMAGFSLVHLLAAAVTLVFVIKHFGFNMIAGLRMMLEARVLRGKKEVFVFWGTNEASFTLAHSLREHFTDPGDYRIIFVRTADDSEATSSKNGLSRLFNFLSLKNQDLEHLQELDCLTTSTYRSLSHLDIHADGSAELPDILGKLMGLKQLARIIRKTQEKVHLFCLTDDAGANIEAVANLKRDKTIHDVADEGKKVYLYCQARYNSIHRVIEDEQMHGNIKVKVVDASHIGVEMLKQRVDLQPVNYVEIGHDATVSSAFNAMVIGFGEVGHDAVRFLYEFASFVKPGCSADCVERSEFHCDIVDKDIKRKAGLFAVNAPSVSDHMTYDDAGDEAQSSITLHDMDVLSVDFYNHLERLIKTLNYIIISLDDDVKNVSLAVRIFRMAVRYRGNLDRFRILVRVRNDHDGHLLRITEHYNRLWAAQTHSNGIHQHTISHTEKIHEPITLFGSLAETYTYDYIVSDQLTEQAKCFMKKYNDSVSLLAGQPVRPDWDEEHLELMQIAGEYKDFSPTLAGIMRLRRVQSQNMANCFHMFTKQKLAQVALGKEKYALLTGKVLSRKLNEIEYSWQGNKPDEAVNRVLEVLAQTEHLRWMASHEILGYRDDGETSDKDEARMLHGCLKPWQKLSDTIKSYDYNIVDVSLGII